MSRVVLTQASSRTVRLACVPLRHICASERSRGRPFLKSEQLYGAARRASFASATVWLARSAGRDDRLFASILFDHRIAANHRVPSSFLSGIADSFVACSPPVLIVNATTGAVVAWDDDSLSMFGGSRGREGVWACAAPVSRSRIENDDSSGLCSRAAPNVNAAPRE
jgi:hypothetical protein